MSEILIGAGIYVFVIYPIIKTIQLARAEAREGKGTFQGWIVIGD